MPERYCQRCGADVEDVGGFCLLGHSLKVASVVEPIRDLKAELERTFDEVQAKVVAVTAEIPLRDDADPAPIRGPAGPPPPPLPADLEEQAKTRLDDLWADYEEQLNQPSDPIDAFAPAPRMDWGPQRAPKARRGLGKLRPEEA